MSLILHLDTSSTVCSVALADQGKLIAVQETYEPRAAAALLAVFIKGVMDEAGKSFSELDAVAVSKGPGSYTGLRISVAAAKGLCYAADKPLIAIDTPIAMASAWILQQGISPSVDTLLVPLIDARRMEVYGAVLDLNLNYVEGIRAEVLEKGSFDIEPEKPRVLFGDGAEKAIVFFDGKDSVKFDEKFMHTACGLIKPALDSYVSRKFEDLNHFEPFYLKEFVGTTRSGKA
ncbi:tRNA (adenosine(37)-N6)-threonylcarbamoyltransferase complex dimerization subunit type 1 TsaB [soil metagenome]